MDIKNKTFIITGGASGLGWACAQHFAAQSANVVMLDLNEDLGNKRMGELGERALFVKTDVTSESSVNEALDKAQQKFQNLHGVINCAGLGTPGKLIDKEGAPLPLKMFQTIINVNLIGTFNVIRLTVARILKQQLAEKENAIIVNTASVATFDGQIGQIAYSASKGGVASMTLPLARELARYKIRVMTIAPGIFDTPMLQGLPEKARLSLGEQVPYPSRLGNPLEYAKLCQHIAENEYLNGEVIRLDGSIRMAPR